MKLKFPLLVTILYFSITALFSNTATATLIYSDKFEATNDPLVVGYQFYFVGHYAQEDYLDTGLNLANQLEFDLDVKALPNSSSFDLEVLLNGILIGGFATSDLTENINNLVFNFTEIESVSENWSLTMRVVTPSCGGCGSLWLEDIHDFSLIYSTINVSEPSTIVIMILGMLGMINRKKQLVS